MSIQRDQRRRRGQYSYQRQMAAQEDAFVALLEWIGRQIERGVMWARRWVKR